MKNVLTAKADEYLNEVKNELTGVDDELLNGSDKDNERTDKKTVAHGDEGRTGNENRNVSVLEDFLLRNHPTQHSRTESSGKRSETFHKLVRMTMTFPIPK